MPYMECLGVVLLVVFLMMTCGCESANENSMDLGGKIFSSDV